MAVLREPAFWYSASPPPWVLRPLAALYGGAVRLRRSLYRRGLLARERLPVPVLVVGNLTVGGTGKTPLVITLVEALRARGYHPGVVSRGYGGSATTPQLLEPGCEARQVGDEPCLIRRHCGVPVAIGRERAVAAQLLVEAGVDLVIADDGLQHYALARDIEICVIDGTRRFGNGRLLPAGPLREPPRRLASVDYRVCNGGLARPDEIPLRLVEDRAYRLLAPAERVTLAEFGVRSVHAVAGIGEPERFFRSLRAQRFEVIAHAFPDHHPYRPADLDFGDALPLLMTEKDAIKCRAFARPHWWAVPVRALLPENFLDALAARLRAL
ncbi:MAG: tetraacyldisaccharide 4'-kinase [Xanthomonadaceae bacterium]|nr:tetraacyldisaccharide 4'-kinase [Xanthomonadaceae bacterium]